MEKERKRIFGMLLRTLRTSVIRNMLTGKGVMRAGIGCNKMDHLDKHF